VLFSVLTAAQLISTAIVIVAITSILIVQTKAVVASEVIVTVTRRVTVIFRHKIEHGANWHNLVFTLVAFN
jgi:hypothetical protein